MNYDIFGVDHLRAALDHANTSFDLSARAGQLTHARFHHAEARRIEEELVNRGEGVFVDELFRWKP